MKALALTSLDRNDEALEICNEIKDMEPSDERLLNDLHQVYNKLGRGSNSFFYHCFRSFLIPLFQQVRQLNALKEH